jgi:hypothetical protein
MDCRSLWTAVVAAAMAFVAVACAPQPVELDTDRSAPVIMPIDSIVILPTEIQLDRIQRVDSAALARLEAGRQTLDSLIAEYVDGLPNARIISESELEGMLGVFSGSRLSQARKVGEQAGSDAAMISTIKRFISRDASQSRPASVAFDYQLIAVASGQVLCAGTFDETQQPFLYNVFSLQRAVSRHFKWISAEELAREGLVDKLDGCVYLNRASKTTEPRTDQ